MYKKINIYDFFYLFKLINHQHELGKSLRSVLLNLWVLKDIQYCSKY